ncbi:putative glutathione-specific gamma-glutamylcyclotransferase 2 [Watersipora subatra]|uniref:putative glutathione-specific gamma-glutamylcyclotransferase 2 n=1 Tax=Watersipora subatra TaxID=2589382 RepID=UPI00355AD4B2
MYVFGYGSLLWKQGFPYEEAIPGYVKGFKRRFWQGSEDHRGEPGRPGRVVSVFESEDREEKVLGIAFRIHEDNVESVKQNLNERETGYISVQTTFYPLHNPDGDTRIELNLFIANENVDTYLGPAPLEDIAWQIYHSHGMCGPNMEYLMKLIWCNRKLFPGNHDNHLNNLEEEVNEIAKRKGESLEKYKYENLHWPIK